MKKCQFCGKENADEMRFCLECGNTLPTAPMVVNVSGNSAQKQSQVDTASFDASFETKAGGGNAGFNRFGGSPPPPKKKGGGGKIFLILGGLAAIFLIFLTAGAAIIAYNWQEIAGMFDKPTPTPQPTRAIGDKTPTPRPSVSPSVLPTVFPSVKPSPSPKDESSVKVSFDKVWVDYNVKENGRDGMRIHIKFTVKDLKDTSCYAAVYFQKKDGTNLTSDNTDFKSQNGNLALFSSLKPNYDNTVYNDVQFFMPYEEFNLKRGKYDLKMDIDLIYENGDLIEHMAYNDFWYEQK